MTLHQQLVAICLSGLLMGAIIELVRRRRLREEYAVLWLVTGAVIVALSLWYAPLMLVTRLIGATVPTSTLFFFGLLFVIVTSLHYSVRISALSDQVKMLAQQLALLRVHLDPRPPPQERGE